MQNFSPDEETEPSYFAYSATLRIHGTDLPIDEITKRLGVEASHRHRRGDQRRPGSRPYPSDAWHTAAIPEDANFLNTFFYYGDWFSRTSNTFAL